MSEKNYRYFAFISYSHRDKEFAHELQHYLESFRLPVALCEKYPEARRDVNPIFRDENNLGAGVLNSRLKTALRQSRHLIVICSPHSAKPNKEGKHYVNDEVYYFLGDTPEENSHCIIPVINRESERVEPHACMPPAVRFLNLLGIDALSKGRERCFNDVVASMLRLDPQELWERRRVEQPQQPLAPMGVSLPPRTDDATWLNNPFKALLYVTRNIFNYKERARRKEYWMGTIGLLLGAANAIFFTIVLLGVTTGGVHVVVYEDVDLFSILVIAILCATLLIHLSMTCRRLHDIGVSGWFQLLHSALPVTAAILSDAYIKAGGNDDIGYGLFMLVLQISILFFLFMAFTNSKPGTNKYGPNPKGL